MFTVTAFLLAASQLAARPATADLIYNDTMTSDTYWTVSHLDSGAVYGWSIPGWSSKCYDDTGCFLCQGETDLDGYPRGSFEMTTQIDFGNEKQDLYLTIDLELNGFTAYNVEYCPPFTWDCSYYDVYPKLDFNYKCPNKTAAVNYGPTISAATGLDNPQLYEGYAVTLNAVGCDGVTSVLIEIKGYRLGGDTYVGISNLNLYGADYVAETGAPSNVPSNAPSSHPITAPSASPVAAPTAAPTDGCHRCTKLCKNGRKECRKSNGDNCSSEFDTCIANCADVCQ